MEIVRERLDIAVSQQTTETLWSELAKDYNPVVYDIKGKLREKIHIDFLDPDYFYNREIYFNKHDQLIYYSVAEDKNSIEVGTLLQDQEGYQNFHGFKERVRDIVTFGTKQITSWSPLKEDIRRFRMVQEETQKFVFDAAQMDAAFIMKDEKLRKLIGVIREKWCCFQEDLMQGPSDYQTAEMINQLETLGLITKEFYVFCKKTGQQISRVNSLEALMEAREHGFRCFNCGRLISDEKISPQIKCTPLGSLFSEPNYWMALNLTSILGDLGISSNRIYYRTEKDNTVFDLFTGIMDDFIFFEVHDRPLSLQKAFLFVSRVKYYKPFRSILLTAHPLSHQVKIYLNSFHDHPVLVIDNLDHLEETVRGIVDEKFHLYIESLFQVFRNNTRIDIPEIFLEKFFSSMEKQISQESRQIKESVRRPAVPVEPEEEDKLGKFEEFMEVLPGEMGMEEIMEDAPRVEEPEPAKKVKKEPLREVRKETEKEVPKEPPQMVKVEPRKEEPVPVPQEPPVIVETVPVKPVAVEPVKVEEEEEISEPALEMSEYIETIPSEFLPYEEIPPAIDTSEEDLEEIAGEVISFIRQEGLENNYKILESRLSKINDIGFYGSVLVDSSGLPVVNHLPVHIDCDKISAYSSIIAKDIKSALEEVELGMPLSVHLDSKRGKLKIFPGDDFCIVAFEEKKAGDVEDEGGTLPGETVLREAIMKKVLEDLSRTDGIQGSVVVARDGLVIESNLPDRFDANTFGYLTSLIITDNEGFMEELMEIKPRQLLIKTADNLYNFIPIENEATIVTCLDPRVPREVWQSRIPHAASMIKSVLS